MKQKDETKIFTEKKPFGLHGLYTNILGLIKVIIKSVVVLFFLQTY